jgi:putative ABC transport system substrate-binding protein
LRGRIYRVVLVLATSPIAEMQGPNPEHPPTRGILHGLRSAGFVEGKNLLFDRRSAEGDPKRYKEIIEQAIGSNPDVMVVATALGLLRAAQSATRTVPIVQMGYPRLVEDGLVASLARPGGNITGPTSVDWGESLSKLLQLFKETYPRLSRVGVVANWWDAAAFKQVRGRLIAAGEGLGVELVPIALHPADPRVTFQGIEKVRVDGLLLPGSPTSYGHREELGRLALAARLPAASEMVDTTEMGGLISYSGDSQESFRVIARYVEKILKGARPGDLPVEQPTKYHLAINMKTAKSLGISVPQSILLRADRVIE